MFCESNTFIINYVLGVFTNEKFNTTLMHVSNLQMQSCLWVFLCSIQKDMTGKQQAQAQYSNGKLLA